MDQKALSFAFSNDEQLRYARHLVLSEIGAVGQAKLRDASVLVIGAGGLGSPALFYLVAAGLGRIGIIDPDIVDISNLQRQILYKTEDCDTLKVDAAKKHLHALNPHTQIEIYPYAFDLAHATDLLERYDVILEGSDRLDTKYLVNDICLSAKKSYISASLRGFSGMLSVYGAPDAACYRCLFPAMPPPESIPTCAQAGVLGTLPGLVGTLQAHEALKLILGIGEPLIGKLLKIDLLAMRFQTLRLPRDPACPACGEDADLPALLKSHERPQEKTSEEEDDLPWLSLNEALARGEDLRWIDIRTPEEFDAGHIPDALSLPLATLQASPRLPPSATPALLYCHTGIRTRTAFLLLRENHPHGQLFLLRDGYRGWLREKTSQ
jgi:adenylyltransferase/sulfurtransferase